MSRDHYLPPSVPEPPARTLVQQADRLTALAVECDERAGAARTRARINEADAESLEREANDYRRRAWRVLNRRKVD